MTSHTSGLDLLYSGICLFYFFFSISYFWSRLLD